MKSLKYRTPLGNDNSGGDGVGSNIKSTTSTAPWWIACPSKTWAAQTTRRKQSLSASFCQSLADLFRNISLHGYNNLQAPEFNLWEKLIWLIVNATTMFALLTVLALAWKQFVAQYVAINLHDPLYPVENVPFPAVAICSNNRFSQLEVIAYANRLSGRDPSNRTVEYFLEHIAYLSSIYYKFEAKYDFNALTRFQSFLDIYGTWDNETFFNTRRVVTRISPKCKDFISRCMLGGDEIECFSPKAFQDSYTIYGPCCTFNLRNSYRKRNIKERFVSADLGLSVVLNTSTADDFASVLNSDGYIVLVHNANKYPDSSSGSAREVFPTRGEESFVSVRARVIDTLSELRSLGPMTRRCYFNDEAPDKQYIVQNTYSFTNCITRCRMRSILALCNCVPFYMPLDLVTRLDGIVYCTLQHAACMVRYDYKWRNILTKRVMLPGLERANEEALYCPLCLPACDEVQYDVSLMSLPLGRYEQSFNMAVSQLPNNHTLRMTDFSVLHVHFRDPYAQYYRRMAGNSWFKAFSTVGNICSIFVGFSVVVLFEILYVLLKNLFRALTNVVKEFKAEYGPKNDKEAEAKLFIIP